MICQASEQVEAQLMAQSCQRARDVAWGAGGYLAGLNARDGWELGGARRFDYPAKFAGDNLLPNRDAVGGNAQRRVLMKIAPTISLVVI